MSYNENENRETVCDIVAEKRARSNEIEGAAGRTTIHGATNRK